MCLANVWVKNDSEEKQILAEVAKMKNNGNNIVISTLFGEEKIIKARIDEIDFINSKVLLKD